MLSVGSYLKQHRESKKLSIRDVERKLKVRERYITAIEADDWSSFSSHVYISGLIKNYAHLLGIDHHKALAFFRREYEKKEEIQFKERVSRSYFSTDSLRVMRMLLIGFAILLVTYFFSQLYIFFSPPRLDITEPIASVFTREESIMIKGETQKETSITIAGQLVYPDDQGRFVFKLPLMRGNNKVVITATGPNGKKTTIEKVFTKTE